MFLRFFTYILVALPFALLGQSEPKPSCNQKNNTNVVKQIYRGIGFGLKEAAHGTRKGLREAARGTRKGLREAARGTGKGLNEAARGTETGFESATASIVKSAYDESKMFYNPSAEFIDMGELNYVEKGISVDENITIYTYYFKAGAPKANIFLLHGNGGNVSTYKETIANLVSGNYNVYIVDWRGYGKSSGVPGYKEILADTEMAFDDFMLQIRSDSLKVIVYGMSLGGQVATKLACDKQQYIDALILDGSLCSAMNLAMDYIPIKFIREDMKKRTDLFNYDYIAENDIRAIENIPKLIIHSKTDNIVPFYHGKRLYENALEPRFFWETNTKHIGTLEELPEETINKIDELLLFTQ